MKKFNRRIRKKKFEIKFYEELVRIKPDFVEALSCLGDAYTREGFIEEGLKVDLRLCQLKPLDPVVQYNLACSYSLLGMVDEALVVLKKAILLGYDDFQFMSKDKDLNNLRKDERFKLLFDKINLRFQIRPSQNRLQKIK